MTDLLVIIMTAYLLLHIAALTQGLDDIAATAQYIRRCERWLAARGGHS